MKRYIALFRGINVGGRNSLPMKQLVSLLEDIGCQHVKTYIQSGNAVFQHIGTSASKLASKIRAAIKKRHGFEPYVLILEAADIRKAVSNNPFPGAVSDPKTLHVGFLSSVPENPDVKTLDTLKKKTERFVLQDAFFYLHAPEGVGRSKLAAGAEKLIGVSMTDRNWRTVCRLLDMIAEMDEQ